MSDPATPMSAGGLSAGGLSAGDSKCFLRPGIHPLRTSLKVKPASVQGRGSSPTAEILPLIAHEVRPGHDEVTGGVTDAGRAEVDDGGQRPVSGYQVADGDVTVEPRRWKRPGRGQRARPDGLAGSDVDDSLELVEGGLDLISVGAGVAATEVGMDTGGRALPGRGLAESGQEAT